MNVSVAALVLVVVFSACKSSETSEPQQQRGPESTPADRAKATDQPRDPLRAAVDTELRPEQDRARDANRKPYEVLKFFGVEPGMKVADIMGAKGYYTEILARAVGASGAVYAQNNRRA